MEGGHRVNIWKTAEVTLMKPYKHHKTVTYFFKQLLLFPMSNCSFLRKNPTILQQENLSPSLSLSGASLSSTRSEQSASIQVVPPKTIIFYLWLYYKWMHTTYLEGEKQPLSPHQCVLKRISKGRNHRSFHLIISSLYPQKLILISPTYCPWLHVAFR